MMFSPFIDLLLLIIVANAAPVLVRHLFANRFAWPVDGGMKWPDQQPVLGDSKTWRGLIASVVLTSLCAAWLNHPLYVGFVVSLFAITGDLCSSFIKRRLRKPPSSMALGLDQIPESLFPGLIMAPSLGLTMIDVFLLVLIFFVVELGLSFVLYHLGIRKKPY